ncbi:GerW family sporulation protein [Halomicrococcus gelatinilyticus]|uniref:GerW family sporulation protein n=1 Tax=Halomicrococcus gelatinilyticus TaxID=1702103 RepID=UPI002E121039
MNPSERVGDVVDRLRESATVETVYGDPIERGGRTVVPVANVRYGFGGGWGTDDEEGEGGGLGGGTAATPVGALEVDEERTRFVRFDERRRTVIALFVGLALGAFLRRR